MKKLLFLGFIILLCSAKTSEPNASQIWNKMSFAMQKVNRVSYEMKSKERFDGKYVEKKVRFRLQANPQKVYGKNLGNGVEFLYVKGWNGDKAFINPNGFPYMNLSLNIYGNRIRNENHHTINHTGFGYMYKLLSSISQRLAKRGLSLASQLEYKGSVTWNGRSCYKVQYYDPNFKYYTHKVTKTETLFDFCERMNLLEYAIMEANNMGYGAKIYAGKTIRIPNNVAKKVIVYVDRATNLPIVQKIYDEKGLFEQYEYTDIVQNFKTSSGEWTSSCSVYGFK
jgi:hypothetical protein